MSATLLVATIWYILWLASHYVLPEEAEEASEAFVRVAIICCILWLAFYYLLPVGIACGINWLRGLCIRNTSPAAVALPLHQGPSDNILALNVRQTCQGL